MAGSRVPGPLGMNRPAKAQGDSLSILGTGFPPGPIGLEVPLDKGSSSPSASKTGQMELNLVGSFPKPNSWTPAKEKQLIAAGTWFPHTLDFKAVAGSGSIEITSEWDFLLKIIAAKSSISRLNYFSHGVMGNISMAGTVDPSGSSVSFTSGWTQIFNANCIVDPYARTWGNRGENSGTKKITVGTTTFTLDDVRAKFAKDATIWLYLCHGGADPMLLKNIANTFQVAVKGFSKVLVYCAPKNFPASRKHKVAVLTTPKAIDSCPHAVSDFHNLLNSP